MVVQPGIIFDHNLGNCMENFPQLPVGFSQMRGQNYTGNLPEEKQYPYERKPRELE